jgi:rubrerythrin
MDIFEFALQKEKSALDYYEQLRQKTTNKGLSNIFSMLVDEERKHLEAIEQMRQQTPQDVAETDVLGDATAIFEKMRESAETFDDNITELQLYEKARDFEKKAWQFFAEKAEEVTDASHKEILKKLAAEEQKHSVLLERICDFVAKPQWFLENAEMSHFDDYVEGVL